MDQPEEVYYNFTVQQRNVVSDGDKSNTYSCSMCSCSYSYEHSLRRHVLRVHINRAYISSKDLSIFGIARDEHHKRQTPVPAMYTCNICRLLFVDEKELSDHVKTLHPVSIEMTNSDTVIIKCPECGTKYNNMRSFNCHMRYHRKGWTSNRTVNKSSNEAAAHNHPIPSVNAIRGTSPSPSKARSQSPSSRPRRNPVSYTNITVSSTRRKNLLQKKLKDSTLSVTSSGSADVAGENADHMAEKGRQLRQRTSMQKQASFFTCTVCRKKFHSYGNMMRHKRLSHETSVKRRPDMAHLKRKTKHRSKFCDLRVMRKYFNKVGDNIAFNVKNCMHGNSKQIEISHAFIRSESKTNLTDLKLNQISKRNIKLYNIKLRSIASVNKPAAKLSGGKRSRSLAATAEQTSAMKKFSQESKSPDVYDKPDLWKYLCLVCLQYFPNTYELFNHQDSVHKRINVGYMEVGKSYNLPLHAVATSKPTGCLPVTNGENVVSIPSKYTCTKCHQHFKSANDLHPHLTICGKDLLKPLEINIPPPLLDPHLLMDNTYGKVKGKKSNWQRGDAITQKRITDMYGFFVRKKKRSRLMMEVEEQQRLEKLRAIDTLSPEVGKPKQEPEATPPSGSQATSSKRSKFTYSCPYCSITFKYRKVYLRHTERKCEMLKRITSPLQSDQVSSEQSSPQKSKNGARADEPSTDTNEKSEFGEDLFSPQKSVAQARVLAKFIHPARTCGPCFTCKKPNMARRYSHLQQRSDNFVQFVMSKCKNISMQSCICKACELNYKNEYEKKKARLERYSSKRKTVSRKKSSKTSALPPPTVMDRPETKKPSLKAQRKGGSQQSGSKKTKAFLFKADSRRRLNRVSNKLSRRKPKSSADMSSLSDSKPYKPVQTKLLEQIFPEDEEGGETSANSLTPSPPKNSTSKGGRYIPVEQDIIDVEKEMIKNPDVNDSSSELTALIIDEGVDKRAAASLKSPTPTANISPTRSSKHSKKGEADGVSSSGDVSATATKNSELQEQNDARMKIIMKFVNQSSSPKRFTDARKMSITGIIDAVTEVVKQDPSLAETLTNAIESACSKEHGFRPRAKKASGPGGAQQSKSLPSVLDGLVTAAAADSTAQVGDEEPSQPSSTTPFPSGQSTGDPVRVDCFKHVMDNITLPAKPTSASTSLLTPAPSLLSARLRMNEDEPAVHSAASAYQDTILRPPTASSPSASGEGEARAPLSAEASSNSSEPFFVPRRRKRLSSGSSQSSISTSARKKFVMTDTSYRHMVEIIDAVANGEITPTLSHSVDLDLQSVTSTDTSISQCSYDFMADSRDSLGCIRTADSSGRASQPTKNLRLANIINKLSSGGRDESKPSSAVASPTAVLNPSSIDSGFNSMVE